MAKVRAIPLKEAIEMVHALVLDQDEVMKGTTTYQYRDPEKRRAYKREYQRAYRARKAAERGENE